jgi:hypothetical protein
VIGCSSTGNERRRVRISESELGTQRSARQALLAPFDHPVCSNLSDLSDLSQLQKANKMSSKLWLVLMVGMAALLLESTAMATCPGNVGASTTPDSAFTVNADDTVVHNASGLMWKQCYEGQSGAGCATGVATDMSWYDALMTSKTSTFAGYTDWRLPNKQELELLVDNTCSLPAINATAFPGTVSGYGSWTSTTSHSDGTYAVVVSFALGYSALGNKANGGIARLVRSGQSFEHLAAVCALDVSGDSAVTADKDAVLLLRYLLGFRGATLIAGGLLGPGRADAQAVEDFIGSGGQYDVFGRPTAAATAMQDGLVLTRLMLGVSEADLLTGIALPTGATFTSGATVRANVNARCATNY